MATYVLPTKEQNEKARRDWIEVIHSRPTWQLKIWLASPRSEWEEAAIREELLTRQKGSI